MPLGDVLSVTEMHSRSVEDNFASQEAFIPIGMQPANKDIFLPSDIP